MIKCFLFISYFYEFSDSIVYLSQPLLLYGLLLDTARKNNIVNQIFSSYCHVCFDFTESLTNEFEDILLNK